MTVLLQPKLRFKQNDGSDFPDWNFSKLASLSDVRDGTHESPKYIKDGFPLITSKNLLKDGNLDFKNINFITQEDFNSINLRSKVDIGDIIFGMIGTIGNPVLLKEDGFAIKNVALIKEKKQLSNKFLIYYLQSNPISKQFYILNTGGTQKFISLSVIRGLLINFPSSKEQQKIASFLSLVDKKIELLTKKNEQLEKYKKGLMQKIFSQEIRFKQDDGSDFPDWQESKLLTFLTREKLKNKDESIKNVLSVNNKKGFISQEEQFEDHRVASKKTNNYRVVIKNNYAFNPSRINVGSIARLLEFESGIVSPMYVVFSIKNMNFKFFDTILLSKKFNNLVKSSTSGSVRESLSFEDLVNFSFSFPSLDEQQKIASFLSALDKKIDLAKQQIEKTQTFKKGLLQQMFV